jgi:hypothetical protein
LQEIRQLGAKLLMKIKVELVNAEISIVCTSQE